MNKEIKFNQITHQTYTITLKNVPSQYYHPLMDIIQKHSAYWNIAINQLEIPIKNAQACKKEIKTFDDKITFDDSFNSLFRQLCMLNSQKEMLHIESKAKWRRYILFDGFMTKRHDYIIGLLNRQGKNKQAALKQLQFKRILLVCCECMAVNWIQEIVERSKVCYKIFDYKSLMANQCYKINGQVLRQNEIQILTYERIQQIGNLLNKSILSKYSTIICDDCQIWTNQQNHFYNNNNLKIILRKILLLAQDKELVMVLSNLPLSQVQYIFLMANLAKPKHFGEDLLKIQRKEINNARWIKQRYSKENRSLKEFLYLLGNTILKNITNCQKQQNATTSHPLAALEHIFHIILDANALQKIQNLDKKYKKVNKKQVLSNFQGQRGKGGFILGQKSKMQQKRFFEDLRQLILSEKLMSVTRYLYHMIKQLNLRVILIIESLWLFEKIQKFLIDQQIDYILYEIQLDDIINQQASYKAFNCTKTKLCVLVRDKICKDYQKCFSLRQRKLQMQLQQQAQQQLGMQKGGLYQLMAHKQLYSDGAFRKQKIMNLPKLNSSRHIVQVDTFWYNFDSTKEKIIAEILRFHHIYPSVQIFRPQNSKEKKQSQQNHQYPQFHVKRPQMVKHFFIAKNLCEKTFLFKYNLNCLTFQEQQQNQQFYDQQQQYLSLNDFHAYMRDKHLKRCQNKVIIKEVYDIDDAFAELQRKISQQQMKEDQPDVIKYNNHIQGLIPQTPNLNQLLSIIPDIQQSSNSTIKQKIISEINSTNIQLKQKQIDLKDIQWLSAKDDLINQQEVVQQSQGTINIAKYLLFNNINKRTSVISKQQTQAPKYTKQEQLQQDISLSLASSIHLQYDKPQQIALVPQKLYKYHIQSQQDCEQEKKQQNIMDNKWNFNRKKMMNQSKKKHLTQVIDVEQEMNVNKKKREKSATSFKLWSNNIGEQKAIGRKYKKLKVVLKPNLSRLRIDGKMIQQFGSN